MTGRKSLPFTGGRADDAVRESCCGLCATNSTGGLDKTVHTEPPTKAKTSSVPESSPILYLSLCMNIRLATVKSENHSLEQYRLNSVPKSQPLTGKYIIFLQPLRSLWSKWSLHYRGRGERLNAHLVKPPHSMCYKTSHKDVILCIFWDRLKEWTNATHSVYNPICISIWVKRGVHCHHGVLSITQEN